MLSVEELVSRARVKLLLKHPFFGSILLRHAVEFYEQGDRPFQTDAYVDLKGTIHVCRQYVERLNEQQTIFLLAHEILHVAFAHLPRMKGKEPELWNQACDIVVNEILIEEKVGECTKDAIRSLGAQDKTVDEVYAMLLAQKQNPKYSPMYLDINSDSGDGDSEDGDSGDGDSDDSDSGSGRNNEDQHGKSGNKEGKKDGDGDKKHKAVFGHRRDLPEKFVGDATSSEIEEALLQSAMDLAQGEQAAKEAGKFGSGLARRVLKAIRSKVPWYQRLEFLLTAKCDQHHSWRRPNKRYQPAVYLPRREKMPGMGEVVIVIDSSGSISDRTLSEFYGHLIGILEQCKPERIHLLFVTTVVEYAKTFEREDVFEFSKQNWYGGTDMCQGIEWAKKNAPDAQAVLILTDGYTPYPDREELPLVWIMTEICNESPVGVTLHLTDR